MRPRYALLGGNDLALEQHGVAILRRLVALIPDEAPYRLAAANANAVLNSLEGAIREASVAIATVQARDAREALATDDECEGP